MARKQTPKSAAPSPPEAAPEPTRPVGRPRQYAEPTAALQVYIPFSLKVRFADHANEHGKSMNSIVADLIAKYLGPEPK